MNPVQRTKDIGTRDKNSFVSSILKYAVLDGVAALILVLGLYGKFMTDGDAFLPFLNDSSNVNLLIGIGAIGMLVCALKIVSLVMRMRNQKGKPS